MGRRADIVYSREMTEAQTQVAYTRAQCEPSWLTLDLEKRGRQMMVRWVAAGVLEAAKGFRRLKGHAD